MTILFKQATTVTGFIKNDNVVRIEHIQIESTDEVIHGCETSALTFYYELAFNGFTVSAQVKTDIEAYSANDYTDDYDREAFNGRRYMNDVPSVNIGSIDTYDNDTVITIAVQCEIMKVVLTDYHSRKCDYLSK